MAQIQKVYYILMDLLKVNDIVVKNKLLSKFLDVCVPIGASGSLIRTLKLIYEDSTGLTSKETLDKMSSIIRDV